MPFKEKIAWISVVTTVLVWGSYFALVAYAMSRGGVPAPVYIVGFGGAVLVQTVLVIVASIVTAILSPRDAGASSDERDRAISRHSYAIAYPVLLALIVCVAASVHLGVGARGLVYEMMGAIVIAEIVHYGAQIAGYRSGRHG